jgi:tetratricopeptide (TPR) repeat protein
MKVHVMVRFGMWQEILDEPVPENAELFSFTTALLRYGRVIALANLGRHDEAAGELQTFFSAKEAVQETRYMFNNPASEVLKIATEMAQGELHYKAGEIDKGFEHLRQAAYLSDNLLYDEPWGWMQPPRHALAALLMEQKRYEEAEEIYRADLGFNDSLPDEIVYVKQMLDKVIARADVPVGASCFCRSTSQA